MSGRRWAHGFGAATPVVLGRYLWLVALAGLVWVTTCAVPSPRSATPTKVSRGGYVAAGMPGGPNSTAFEDGLVELGWRPGENLELHYRWGSGAPDEFPVLVAELLALRVDVIVATAMPAVQAARQAPTTTPIVMTSIGDPVRNGLVESFNRPGGNLTGVSIMAPELSRKRLELLKNAIPALSRVAVLHNPAVLDIALNWEETQRAAQPLGVDLIALPISSHGDLDRAFRDAQSQRAEGLIALSEDIVFRHRNEIMERAVVAGLPTMGTQGAYAVSGALMAYGPNYPELFRRAAAHVDKILKGTHPSVIPVEQPMRFDFVINLRIARALGIELPASTRLEATEAIE
jgi:putative tryptophan/tyrosine transport system substrate-binding protein